MKNVVMSAFFSLVLLLASFVVGTKADPASKPKPWKGINYSFIQHTKEGEAAFKVFASAICNNDSLSSLICFDYAWRKNCLEIFAVYTLTDDVPYVFPKATVPVIEVSGYEEIDMNPIIKVEQKIGKRVFPWTTNEDFALWRVAVGSIKILTTNKDSVLYQLLHGDRLNIYFKLQNGTVMRSNVLLTDIKPYLDEIIKEAAAAKPEGAVCH